jgi:hypothetical protein
MGPVIIAVGGSSGHSENSGKTKKELTMTEAEIKLHQMIAERDDYISSLKTSCRLLQKCLEEERERNRELENRLSALKIPKN